MQVRNCDEQLSALTCVRTVKKLVDEFPNEKEKILGYIETHFKKIIKDPIDFIAIVSLFEEYKERLFSQLMIQEHSKYLVSTPASYFSFRRSFPEKADILFNQVCFFHLKPRHIHVAPLSAHF